MTPSQRTDLHEVFRLLAEMLDDDARTRRSADVERRSRGYGHWRRGEYITVAEAATLLRVDPATVKRRIYRGQIPAERFNRTWLIRRVDVARQSSTATSTSRPRTFPSSSPGRPQDTTARVAS
jgi:excisionase family DNA binding protein